MAGSFGGNRKTKILFLMVITYLHYFLFLFHLKMVYDENFIEKNTRLSGGVFLSLSYSRFLIRTTIRNGAF